MVNKSIHKPYGDCMSTRKHTKQLTPLIVEPHPDNYNGYPFITLIQYYQEHILCIVDNVSDKMIKAFVLDHCSNVGIDEEHVIAIASEWFNKNKDKHPLSIEFSIRGISLSPIYRSFNIEYVTRVIGPMSQYDMGDNVKIRRRRKKTTTKTTELHKKSK